MDKELLCLMRRHIPKRYHHYCNELYSQLLCLQLNMKSCYLFDLFPFNMTQLRQLIIELGEKSYLNFESILLNYSINDICILNLSSIDKLIDSARLLIDLTTMTTYYNNEHPVFDELKQHLLWINSIYKTKVLDFFDPSQNDEWSDIISKLNHTTVFGYLLKYPIIFYYSSFPNLDNLPLNNYRISVDIDNKHISNKNLLLYSFSYPNHANIDERKVKKFVDNWSEQLLAITSLKNVIKHIDIKCELNKMSVWCL
ncbi:unnamed protein product [Didymodactylos carnosus]|uniref:Uncharacterized protein n=1 Tax=Didymodactylos carnosus TaxID=1234261 RepID=A0A813U1R0_9BILA|nr:unnamed protein product [Didymodactylos carnosus]CAF1034378.1 unnamed protein product [Didymodactylos carnosus]CAF3608456.1 unnamed protein product [Didymodactylos carnosus]CAF3802675.1 unnamed protein product [Didymodactylos carnosus]